MSLGTRVYSIVEGVKIAFDSIRTNKVRAGLTILGIAVGVFVVTVMSAAVHGINEGVSSSIAAAVRGRPKPSCRRSEAPHVGQAISVDFAWRLHSGHVTKRIPMRR